MNDQNTGHTIGMKKIGLLIAALLFLSVSSGAYAYVMYGVTAAIGEIAIAKGNVESVGKRSATTQAAERFLADTAVEYETLARYVVSDADVARPIEIIEETARRARVDIEVSSADTLEVPDWQSHDAVRVTFSAEGSYASLVHLASALETLPYAAALERMTLEATADSWLATYSVLFVKEKTP